MAQAAVTIDLAVPADEVWELIGGFGSLPDWQPNIPRLELSEGGRVRRFTIDGSPIVERLMAFDHLGRSYTYTILEAPLPITEYLSTLRVSEIDGGNGARVEWSGEFVPNGVSIDQATAVVLGIYEEGLKALGEQGASEA